MNNFELAVRKNLIIRIGARDFNIIDLYQVKNVFTVDKVTGVSFIDACKKTAENLYLKLQTLNNSVLWGPTKSENDLLDELRFNILKEYVNELLEKEKAKTDKQILLDSYKELKEIQEKQKRKELEDNPEALKKQMAEIEAQLAKLQ